MDDNSGDRLTLARRFLEPSNSTHRQYEALRAFFVDGLSSAEVAARFGYTPGVHVHGPMLTIVQQQTRCGRMKADPADGGSEASSKGASVCRTEALKGK